MGEPVAHEDVHGEVLGSAARVAVIADTHLPRGARRLPDACVAALRSADLVLHAGDVVAASALAELEALGQPLHAVAGNMDAPELQAILPVERIISVAGARIGMVHVPGAAAGREARLRRRFPGCQAIVYGHTHVAQVEQDGGVWILNPGSPTERRRSPAHTMLLLDIRAGAIRPTLVRLDP